MTPELKAKFAATKLLVLDVDGVMTDGGIGYRADGSNSLTFYIPDGLGIVLLQRAGIKVGVLTTSDSPIIAARVQRLGITLYRPGRWSKGKELPNLVKDAGVSLAETAYLSDDINDCTALAQVGLPLAVANAQPRVLAMAAYVTKASGGKGGVREVCDLLLESRGIDIVDLWENGGEKSGQA